MSGIGRIALFAALLVAAIGVAKLRAQTVLGDPRDAARTFASNCSACHKSPRGLAKSGQIAGFLRQHYTTGPEMSAAMAAYLVAAGAAPPEKKSAATADGAAAAKTKSKKQEQLSAAHSGTEQTPDSAHQRTLRGKQRPTKADDEPPTPAVAPPAQPSADETARPATSAALITPPPAAAPPQPPPIVFDIPLPPLPEGLPEDLTQSAFSSSPLP